MRRSVEGQRLRGEDSWPGTPGERVKQGFLFRRVYDRNDRADFEPPKHARHWPECAGVFDQSRSHRAGGVRVVFRSLGLALHVMYHSVPTHRGIL